MFRILKIVYILCFTLVFSNVCQAQNKNVFNEDNQAQVFAVLSAQYSTDAYLLTQKSYFSSNIYEIKQNCDTASLLIQYAMQYADSAFNAAYDTCEYGMTVILGAKDYQIKAIEGLKRISRESNLSAIRSFSEKSMYAISNAIVEVYKASLYLDYEERFDSVVDQGIEEFAIDCDNLTIDTVLNNKPREITRLEVDEFSYMTIKEVYGKRLDEIDDELNLLNGQSDKNSGDKLAQINEAITQLEVEQKECSQKMRSSEDRLISVRNDLSEEMLQLVHKDIFKTDKYGFYNEDVPIPEDSEIPEGLVFKVQMAFFKNQLPPKHFDGIFPMLSLKVDDTYYRYVAGNFSKYIEAAKARAQVVKKGYSDSFVIAYFNGEKISLCEAIEKERGIN